MKIHFLRKSYFASIFLFSFMCFQRSALANEKWNKTVVDVYIPLIVSMVAPVNEQALLTQQMQEWFQNPDFYWFENESEFLREHKEAFASINMDLSQLSSSLQQKTPQELSLLNQNIRNRLIKLMVASFAIRSLSGDFERKLKYSSDKSGAKASMFEPDRKLTKQFFVLTMVVGGSTALSWSVASSPFSIAGLLTGLPGFLTIYSAKSWLGSRRTMKNRESQWNALPTDPVVLIDEVRQDLEAKIMERISVPKSLYNVDGSVCQIAEAVRQMRNLGSGGCQTVSFASGAPTALAPLAAANCGG